MSGYLGDTDYGAGIIPGTTQNLDPGTPGGAGSYGVALGSGTGRYGQTAMTGAVSSNPFVQVWSWLNTPFTTPMDPSTVFMLVGVVLVAIVAWNLILYHIRIAAETI